MSGAASLCHSVPKVKLFCMQIWRLVLKHRHSFPNFLAGRRLFLSFEMSVPAVMDSKYVATEIDPKDVGTPDEWVPRDPRLIRLTGKHPFNCEPPLDLLYDQGFISPPAIHYVRNHGHAPNIKWEDHKLTIDGLVEKPMTFTMDQLVKDFPQMVTTLPVTLVCAGNRRKEQNMTKKTIGFSWGPCAHATSYWTGIRLCDMLEYLGVDRSKARHVCMVGAEELPNGTYGTSIPMSLAMEPSNDVLIAWQMNGINLTTDHGYPLRIVIPGRIFAHLRSKVGPLWAEHVAACTKLAVLRSSSVAVLVELHPWRWQNKAFHAG